MNFHHIGIYVKNINVALNEFKKIFPGIKISKLIIVKIFKVKIVFIRIDKNLIYELIEPFSKKNPLYISYNKKKFSIHHIGYYVQNIRESINKLKKNGYIQITDLKYSEALKTEVVFLISKLNIVTELVSHEPKIYFK
jgi:methylmalonyl-CoA/ethylmalonyl-CoA epimerase